MSEKVKLPREVAQAIDMLRLNGWTDYFIVVKSYETDADNHEIRTIRNWIRNNTGSFDDESEKATTLLLQALVNGYEVEQTPEDKVRELYQYWDNYEGDSIYSGQTIASHIADVLDILNIKIDGVNT